MSLVLNNFLSTDTHVPEVCQILWNCALVRMNLHLHLFDLEYLSNAAIFDYIEKLILNCTVFRFTSYEIKLIINTFCIHSKKKCDSFPTGNVCEFYSFGPV